LKEFKENGFIFDENSDLDGPGIGADGEPAYYVMGEDISAVPPVSENEAAGALFLNRHPLSKNRLPRRRASRIRKP